MTTSEEPLEPAELQDGPDKQQGDALLDKHSHDHTDVEDEEAKGEDSELQEH